ncbi:ABC transporter permease subunit [Streptomyces sp. YC504]|uniref:ABC transporter permease subunit n=1 Tax=Streptomyces mesophilus TaxID=1775132 RepID=A0A6G4XMR7_9ACTN|nr:ABC transporter permease [Streptomyces mesophilus]NGO78879.1 ABC transporter permease subunit [Streptomyces mesophilus]
MSTAALSPGPGVLAGRYGFAHVLRMEWIKLRSLRSTWWALFTVVAGMIAMGVVTMANTKAPSADKAATFDPTNNVLAGVALGQLVIGVIGVLLVTGEYSSGSMRSTLAAVPRRPLVLAAKAAVFGGVTLVLSEVVAFLTFLVGRAALDPAIEQPSLTDGGVLRAVLMSGAYLGLIAVMAVGIGALVRHTASAIGVLVGLLFVVPAMLAGATGTTVAKFFPTMIAGNSLAVSRPMPEMLTPWAGFALLLVYTAVVYAAGVRVLVRRDA